MNKLLLLTLMVPLVTGCLESDEGGTEVSVNTTGNIEGQIIDSVTSAPLASVSVAVGTNTATTNSSGVYTINSVNTGSRTVTASLNGYQAYSDTATIEKGTTITFNITLTPVSNTTSSLNWDTGNWDSQQWQ